MEQELKEGDIVVQDRNGLGMTVRYKLPRRRWVGQRPLLEFANGQKLEHPQDGLFLYGPVAVPGTPQTLHVGIVGTPEGIKLVETG